VVGVAEKDLRAAGAGEQRIGDVEPIAASDGAGLWRMRDRGEARGGDAARPRPSRDPLLVESWDAAVQRLVVVLDESDGAVAGLTRIAPPAADGAGVGRADGDARTGPGEATVRGPVHPHAARVVGAIEVDLRVVHDAGAVEDNGRIAAAVEVVAGWQRRERRDAVVPVGSLVRRGVEARRGPAEAIVVRPRD